MRITKTGISKLDEMLGGGLPKYSLTTVSGPAGSGKSILATQFLVNGIREFTEPGMYIVLEENKDIYLSSMEKFNFNLVDLIRDGLLTIIEFPQHEVNQLFIPTNPLKELIEQYGTSRVVIDSIMPIAIAFDNNIERQRAFLQLVSNIRKWYTTTIIISENISRTTDISMPYTNYGIENLSQAWIHLYFEKTRRGRERFLEVLKVKGMSHSTKITKFKITEEGIVF